MVPETILELFDAQIRRDGVASGAGWSCILRPPDDGDVERMIAWMGEQPGSVEWKYYAHDGPELAERLRAAGLVPEDEETVLVAEAASIPAPEIEVTITSDRGAESVHVAVIVDDEPASRARVDLEPGLDFAGLYGGSTLPEHRGRGYYRATVAKRAEIARERGYRYLYVDALPTSRPILERLGFVRLTSTTPYVPRADSTA